MDALRGTQDLEECVGGRSAATRFGNMRLLLYFLDGPRKWLAAPGSQRQRVTSPPPCTGQETRLLSMIAIAS